METVAQAVGSTSADRRRHRSGCFRWYGDGRCVDCGRYTGTASDVVEVPTGGGVVYSRPAVTPKSLLVRLTARLLDGDAVASGVTGDDWRPTGRPLTADQLAVQRAWREWRAQQGDAEPDVPRRQRRK